MDFERLLDLYEREHAIESMRDWVQYPQLNSSKTCADTIRRLIVKPMEIWLDGEWQRLKVQSFSAYAHIEAAQEFITLAEDVAQYFESETIYTIYNEHIDLLDERWREFQLHMGNAAIYRAEKFKRKSGGVRQDALRRRMENAFCEFVTKHNREPEARELWKVLPDGDKIDYIDNESNTLNWMNDKGSPKETTFKVFENSYSKWRGRFRKKIKKIKK